MKLAEVVYSLLQEEFGVAQRKTHTPQVKAKVAIEAIKDRKSMAQIASQFEAHPAQVSQWKKQTLEVLVESFKGKALKNVRPEDGFTQDQLFAQIGQLKVELGWLKKNLLFSNDKKRQLVEHNHPELSISRQCELLGLSRSSFYYETMTCDSEDLRFMRLIDEKYLKYPFYGSCKLADTIGRI